MSGARRRGPFLARPSVPLGVGSAGPTREPAATGKYDDEKEEEEEEEEEEGEEGGGSTMTRRMRKRRKRRRRSRRRRREGWAMPRQAFAMP